jgi:hypothetical protein
MNRGLLMANARKLTEHPARIAQADADAILAVGWDESAIFHTVAVTALFNFMNPRGQPGFILYVQTFGDLVTFNPHIHALVADGVFLPSGTFRVLPPLPEDSLCEALHHKVLGFLVEMMPMSPSVSSSTSSCGTRYRIMSHRQVPIRPGRSARPSPSPITRCRTSLECKIRGRRSAS